MSCSVGISIHALLAESDEQTQTFEIAALCISIHALLAESDIKNSPALLSNNQFLSTLSLRRATYNKSMLLHLHIFLSTLSLRRATSAGVNSMLTLIHFYPRSPCGERRSAWVQEFPELYISIHALLAESDVPNHNHGQHNRKFLSTLSLRRATERAL